MRPEGAPYAISATSDSNCRRSHSLLLAFPRPRARPGKGEGDVENGGPWPGLAALDEPVIDAHLPIRPYSPGNQMSTDGRSFTWCLVRLRWIRRVPILATALIGIATSLRPHPCPFWRSTWVIWRPPGST